MLMMKYITCSETCTIQAVEKWRSVRTKSPIQCCTPRCNGKKWKWDTSFAQTLIICMINERCQDQNPNGRRMQLKVSATKMKRSIRPSPACLIRDCSDPFPEQSNALFANPTPPLLFFFFLSFEILCTSELKHPFQTTVQQLRVRQWRWAWKRQWRNTIPLNHFSLLNVTLIAEQFNKCHNKQRWHHMV